MPEPGIILDPDQAEELRELITLTGIVQEWLHYAGDIILDNLADFAYHDTFHPRSYAAWLIQDLACLSSRLREATAPAAQQPSPRSSSSAAKAHHRPPAQDQQIPPATPLTQQLP
jgi:hypothetical protein